METPSFSNSDTVSLSEEFKREEEKREEEEFADKSTQTEPTIKSLSTRVFHMEQTLRMVYARVRNTEIMTKRNISVLLDQSDKHFEKMMMGFRAIQRCWDLSADAQMQMGEAVDDFKSLTGLL